MDEHQIMFNLTGIWPEPSRKKTFRNPLRIDPKPSCYFEYHKGYLRLVDWGDRLYHNTNIFELAFVKEYGRRTQGEEDYKEAIRLVKEIGDLKFVQVSVPDFFPSLSYGKRNWTKKALDYWARYGITKEMLKEDDIFLVDWYRHNTKETPKLFYKHFPKLGFAYKYLEGDKIYQPFSKNKWFSATPSHAYKIWLTDSKELLLFGSYKDARIAHNFGYSVIERQSENTLLDFDLVRDLSTSYKVYIAGDCDDAGKKLAFQLQKRYLAEGIQTYTLNWPERIWGEHKLSDLGEMMEKWQPTIVSQGLYRSLHI